MLLNVLDTELSRSRLAECSWRPLALLPYGKKSSRVMTPEAFAKASARSNLVYLNKFRKNASTGKLCWAHMCMKTINISVFFFFFNQTKCSKAPCGLVIWQGWWAKETTRLEEKQALRCTHSTTESPLWVTQCHDPPAYDTQTTISRSGSSQRQPHPNSGFVNELLLIICKAAVKFSETPPYKIKFITKKKWSGSWNKR